MNTTELIRPTLREMLVEAIPLVGAIAGYGPPVIFLVGPWLLLALMLSGPFAVLLTLIAVMLLAAAVFCALTAAILAPPYLLIRRLRSVRARRAASRDRATLIAPVRSTQVAS